MKRIVILGLMSLALFSCTSEARHKIARVLFDGVPPLEGPVEVPRDVSSGSDNTENESTPEDTVELAPVYIIHKPYKDQNCSSCHNFDAPESSQLSGPDLCLSCHDTFFSENALVHIPAIVDCLQCHTPHKSTISNLLVQEMPDLCLTCHGEEELPHPTDMGSCTDCHNPHETEAGPEASLHVPFLSGSCSVCHDVENSYALFMEGTDLCLMCHGDTLSGAAVTHIPAMSDCMICHTPHQSQNARLLKQPVEELCLECHDRTRVEEVHGAVMECTSCHTPHQSDSEALLKF